MPSQIYDIATFRDLPGRRVRQRGRAARARPAVALDPPARRCPSPARRAAGAGSGPVGGRSVRTPARSGAAASPRRHRRIGSARPGGAPRCRSMPNRASASARSVPSPRSACETTQRSPSPEHAGEMIPASGESPRVPRRPAAPEQVAGDVTPGARPRRSPASRAPQQVGVRAIRRHRVRGALPSSTTPSSARLARAAPRQLREGGDRIGHALGLEANRRPRVDPGEGANPGPPRLEEVVRDRRTARRPGWPASAPAGAAGGAPAARSEGGPVEQLLRARTLTGSGGLAAPLARAPPLLLGLALARGGGLGARRLGRLRLRGRIGRPPSRYSRAAETLASSAAIRSPMFVGSARAGGSGFSPATFVSMTAISASR